MASGVTHAVVSVAAAPFVLIKALEITSSLPLALCAATGCGVLGILLTPDLDQETRGWAENKLLKSPNIIVAFLGVIHLAFWYPYAKAIPHRHWSSHAPIIGTAIRALYAAAILLFLYWVAVIGFEMTVMLPQWASVLYYGRAVMCGLAVSDTLHWVVDIVTSAYKKVIRRFSWKRRKQKKQTKKTRGKQRRRYGIFG